MSKSKFGEKLEDALNKYWYEIGLALPHPKSKNQTRDNWTFATKKQSTFSLGYISEDGDASVKWNFKKDYGTNAADYHVFGDSETTLSVADDIMPVIRQLAQEKTLEKTKSQKTGEFLWRTIKSLIFTGREKKKRLPRPIKSTARCCILFVLFLLALKVIGVY